MTADARSDPRVFHFLLLPDFPLYAVVPATEALRIANQNAGRSLYDWRFVSAKGGSVRAGNGMSIEATAPLCADPRPGAPLPDSLPDSLIVCAGNEPTQHLDKALLARLRWLAAHGVMLGALDTGVFALAAAGIVRDRTVTLHWEAMPVFRDLHPKIAVVEQLFVIDRGLATAAGGNASLDLMLAFIAQAHGRRIAQTVADAFIHGQPRRAETGQRSSVEHAADEHAIVHRAVRLMGERVEYRLGIDELCEALQVSRRRLERTFKSQAGCSPAAAYLDIRLQAAREQLFYSCNTVAHIAEVTGFQSDAHFCRAFRKRFGASPSSLRRSFHSDQRATYHPAGTRLFDTG